MGGMMAVVMYNRLQDAEEEEEEKRGLYRLKYL